MGKTQEMFERQLGGKVEGPAPISSEDAKHGVTERAIMKRSDFIPDSHLASPHPMVEKKAPFEHFELPAGLMSCKQLRKVLSEKDILAARQDGRLQEVSDKELNMMGVTSLTRKWLKPIYRAEDATRIIAAGKLLGTV